MMQAQDGQARVERRRQARNTGASQLAKQHFGERIRLRRTLLGLSQSGLGRALGLSFQQLQKYECGTSSIGAGQLCGIARALDVPVSFFYDGLQDRLKALKSAQSVHNQAAKSAQAEGDALYWPIYNLDLKNPHAKVGLEHADLKDLIASMRSYEAEVMRLLGEIEALVGEVQA